MIDIRVLCCPKPDEIVSMYLQGVSKKSLTNDVYRSKMFAKKELSRGYVDRCIYKYLMKQKNLEENNE